MVPSRISGSNTDSQGLDTLVKSLETKKTLSTIDKSSYDWDKFKDKEGIKEEVEAAKKNGYIEKQEFLSRVDQRQFEKERAQGKRKAATTILDCFLRNILYRRTISRKCIRK